MPAPYTGGCQCGSVSYVATAEPMRVSACHCKECQRQSGSAFVWMKSAQGWVPVLDDVEAIE